MLELKKTAYESGISLKELINKTLRSGLKGYRGNSKSKKYKCPEYALGIATGFDLDRALALAESMENVEITRKIELRK